MPDTLRDCPLKVERIVAEFWSYKDVCWKLLYKEQGKGWGEYLQVMKLEKYEKDSNGWALEFFRAWKLSWRLGKADQSRLH